MGATFFFNVNNFFAGPFSQKNIFAFSLHAMHINTSLQPVNIAYTCAHVYNNICIHGVCIYQLNLFVGNVPFLSARESIFSTRNKIQNYII